MGTGMARKLYEKYGFIVIEEIHDESRGELYCMRLNPILSLYECLQYIIYMEEL